MNLSCLSSLPKEVPAYRQLVRELSTAKSDHKVVILNAAKAYLIAALHEEPNLPVLAVIAQPEIARKLRERTTRPALFLHRRLVYNSAFKDILPLTQLPEF